MVKQSKQFKEYLELLDGQEIISSYYQTSETSCIMVKGLNVIQGGKVIDNLTPKKAQRLFKEMFKAEFGIEGIDYKSIKDLI